MKGRAANAEGMRRDMHEKAVMSGTCKDGQVFGPILNLHDLYETVGRAPKTERHIDVLAIARNRAIGNIAIKNWHRQVFIDFHELICKNDEWKIIAKTYQD